MKKLFPFLIILLLVFTACEKEAFLELAQRNLEVESEFTECTVIVTSSSSWHAINHNDWIKLRTTIGDAGCDTLEFTVKRNHKLISRNGVIVVKSDDSDVAAALYITQSATSYSVGSLVTINGTKGVVYYLDNNVTKVVSAEEAKLKWSTEDEYTYAMDWYDGSWNMKKIQTISCWMEKYPSFKWCADYGVNWYLPSYNELLEIYNQRKIINATMKENSYTGFINNYYWSSTELSYDSAYAIDFYDGDNFPIDKYNNTVRVRAILTL